MSGFVYTKLNAITLISLKNNKKGSNFLGALQFLLLQLHEITKITNELPIR
ncbi:MAG: hypothetical protein RLZZ609_2945 [Cyanobacteriota bacterium]|jgi:hypothetical protein